MSKGSLRVSVTDLDAVRRFRADDEASLADLLAQLRRESPPTEAMRAGSAFHAALELALDGEHDALEADGYRFALDLSEEIDLPPIREVKVTRDYLIDGVTVTLVGKADAVDGRCITDHKMTGHFDPERFLGSMQWRAYLCLFEADVFRWNVFEAREDGPQAYVIHHLHRLHATRYPGMSADVEREVAAFLALAQEHMPERIAA